MDKNSFFGRLLFVIVTKIDQRNPARFKIIPDKVFLKIKFFAKFGKTLDLREPKTFNEKLQWLKLYDRNIKYTQLVDKYEVRKYISNTIGEEHLIPLIGIWDNFDSINFEDFPNEFVLKATHDSGSVIVCKDKQDFDKEYAQKVLNESLKRNYFYSGREWPYKDVKPRIIAEMYMKDEEHEDLRDYKFFCFNGIPKLVLVCTDRHSETGLKETFYDIDWNKTEIKRPKHEVSEELIIKPKNLKNMIMYAKMLSKNIPFVRVDFYEIKGHIYFGELTFFPAMGFEGFSPDKYDQILGDMITLP